MRTDQEIVVSQPDDLKWLPHPLSYHVAEWFDKKPEEAISTGLNGFDSLLEGGFRPGEIITIAALTSYGKSAFALTLAKNMAAKGLNVCFFTFEMSIQAVLARLTQQLTRVSARRVQSKVREGQYGLDDTNYGVAAKAMEYLTALPVFFSAGQFLTIENMEYRMSMLCEHRNIDIFIFDYVQVMTHGDNKASKLGELMASIRATAKNVVHTPCLFMAQINRNVDKPSIYTIKDSHSIVIESDVAGCLHTPVSKDDWHTHVPFDLSIEKNRAGSCGVVNLDFLPHQVEFVNV